MDIKDTSGAGTSIYILEGYDEEIIDSDTDVNPLSR